MPGTARQHHFVSAFLLAGFTPSGEKTGELWVTDFKTGKQFTRTPKTTGFQTDFHAVEVENVEPDYLETKILANIEGRCAPTIKAVVTNRRMPEGQAYNDLIYFVALMMVKTPKARRICEQGVDWLNKLLLKQVLKTGDSWESLQAEMRGAGMEVDDAVTYVQMKEFVERDRFKFKVDQNWLLSTMMGGPEAVLPCLIQRTWSVLYAEHGGLICSDHPATCSFIRPVSAMWSPAPCLPHTEVQFPLSRQVILIGSLDGSAITGQLNRKGVAYYNGRTLRQSERFVYSTEKDFIWLDRNRQIKSRPDELVAARQKGTKQTDGPAQCDGISLGGI